MSAGAGTSDATPNVADLEAQLDELRSQAAACQERKDEHYALIAEIGVEHTVLNDQIAAVEAEHNDALALEELRGREDTTSAIIAARTIAATMPDAARAAKFEALAAELAG